MQQNCDRERFASRISLAKLALWDALIVLSACSGGSGSAPAPAPVAAADTYVFPSTQPLAVASPGVLKNDSGGSLAAVLISAPLNAASFTLNANGSFTYTSKNGTSTDTFSYKATNANGSSNVATVSLAPNQPPVAVNACLSTPTNTSLNGTLTATDEPASQPDAYMLVTDPIGPFKGNVTINPNGTFTYTPNNPGYVGMDKFKFRVTDQLGLTSTGIVTVLINGSVRIMPLGDSITQGVFSSGSCDSDGNCPARSQRISYRKKLWTDLENLSTSYGVDLIGGITADGGTAAGLPPPDNDHEGHPGDCAGPIPGTACILSDLYNSAITRNISDNVTNWLNVNQPDFILLHIGTNGLAVASPSTNASYVNTILNNVSNWTQTHYPITVFIARIIPPVDNSFDVTTYNNDVAALPLSSYAGLKILMVDQQNGAGLLYTIDNSSNCLTNGVCNGGDMASNLHPNPSGYDKMAAKWETDIKSSGVLPSCP